ncbi:MAG: hypothetical protein E7620_00215 [Ruminococcaceae bacterium]|nr:hypothetical protein [Oscillospiraceae bacterium]
MKKKTKKILSFLVLALFLSVLAPSVTVFAATVTPNAERILWSEDFSGVINTSSKDSAVKESNGVWANISSGSSVTTKNGYLQYTPKKDDDFLDVRFRSIYNSVLNLRRDFIFSFKVKPDESANLGRFAWYSNSEGASGSSGNETNQLRVAGGSFYTYRGESSTLKAEKALPANQWSLVEIAFNYDPEAIPDYYAIDPSIGKGAIVSYTVMVNGVALYTQETAVKFQNIESFRCFRYSGDCELEIDDVRVAVGSTSLMDITDLTPPAEPEPEEPSDEEPAEQQILFREDFSKGSVNTSGSPASIAAAKGLFVCNENGSTYTLEDGTLKYLDRLSYDYIDLRFNNSGTELNLARDFILSFKVKPKMSNIEMKFSWRNTDYQKSEDRVHIMNGRLRISGVSYPEYEFKKDEWTLMEIAFHYNKNVNSITGEKGAIDSYTVMINGKAIQTVDAGIRFHNIDLFRLFRYSSCEFEVDDLTIATKNDSLAASGEYADWSPKVYFVDHESVADYAYSFCVVGDTQKVTNHASEKLYTLYRWILRNVEPKKIGYVFGLGDITDTDNVREWGVAQDAISLLDGVVPYSIIRGNHDGSENFNFYFNNNDYKKQFGGFYGSTIENSWRAINVGGVDYLMVTLDFGASDDVLEWAGSVIEAHPNHRVIVTTHAYLYGDGTTLDSHDAYAPEIYIPGANNGEDIRQKLITKYENIFLVISGHIASDYVITSQITGDHGNTVTQMLIDPQGVDGDLGATGMITMLYFSEDGKEIYVETYSTIHEKHFLTENQFSVDLGSWKTVGSEENTGAVTGESVPTEEETHPVTSPSAGEPTAEEQTDAPATEKLGCGSAVRGYGWLLFVLAVMFVCVRRRRQQGI